jgi:copper chaperone NosL
MMRKGASLILMVTFLVVGAVAAYAADDVAQVPSCKYCGMDRDKFAHSRTLIQYDDGKAEGFCSIHCAAVDLAVNIDRTPKSISVGDYKTKELIDAEKAVWVIGGGKPGVMSGRAKWAFKEEADAAALVKESGGTLATFDEAMKAAYEDMYQDTKAIRERRATKRKAMQEKVGMEKKAMEHGHQ